jgi:CDGSH-type Zn-finger protein
MDMIDEVTIKVRQSGPYLVRGKVTVTDSDGNPYTIEGPNIALCRCGGSQTKPFCDGSHKTNGFDATERASVVEAESA